MSCTFFNLFIVDGIFTLEKYIDFSLNKETLKKNIIRLGDEVFMYFYSKAVRFSLT